MLPDKEASFTGMLFAAVAYLLGSLPFSVWIGKIFFRTDIREHGSGNAGATNAWRVLGWKAGLPVLLLDTGKGFAATFLPFLSAGLAWETEWLLWSRIACGSAAALGHIYPLFAGFRGGKAVATLFGVILGLSPMAAAGSLGVFILVLLIFRMVSLGSILAAISLPVMGLLNPSTASLPFLLFFSLITFVVLLTHGRNIRRMIRGEESRIRFRRD